MTWLNIAAILFLTKAALVVLKDDYEEQKKAGKDPALVPGEVSIQGADFWEIDIRNTMKKTLIKINKADI